VTPRKSTVDDEQAEEQRRADLDRRMTRMSTRDAGRRALQSLVRVLIMTIAASTIGRWRSRCP